MLRLVAPGLAITATSLTCPNLKSSGAIVPLRPPGWVFAVVWPILYVTTGMSWSRSKLDTEFIVLITLLCAWLVAYSCKDDKTMGRNVLMLATLFSYYMVSRLKDPTLFLPLAAWLTFATYLNFTEVRLLSSSPQTPDAPQGTQWGFRS